jgi:hypothetical protein
VQTTHVYPTLKEAALAVLRIYQPLTTLEILRELRSWKHAGMLGFPFFSEAVPIVLGTMQEDGLIEYAVGTWRTRCHKQ